MAAPTTPASEVIAKHIDLFGADTYSYAKVVYRGKRVPFILTCNIHGDFECKGLLSRMYSWGKCGKCKADERKAELRNHYTELHGSKYDYSKVDFSLSKRDKVEIICKKHNKSFFQSLDHHSTHGCPDCGKKSVSASLTGVLKFTTEEFIDACKSNLPDIYDYSKLVYNGAASKVSVRCTVHDTIFTPTANAFRDGAAKCPYCSEVALGFKPGRSTTAEFIAKAKAIHGDKYDYSCTTYLGSNKVHVSVNCPIHSTFTVTPNAHLSDKTGCPSCSVGGSFDPSKPGYLYYLKVTTDDGQILYKIGITNRSVEQRFSLTELSKIEVIKLRLFDNGQEARDWETKILRKGKPYQYKGPNILKSGNTELFTEDVVDIFFTI